MSKIHAAYGHPQWQELKLYKPVAPVGEWTGRLDHLAWGRSSNLFCYFTNVANDQKVSLSVFSSRNYRPYNSRSTWGFNDITLLGQHFRITTSVSQKGWPTFLKARKVSAPKPKT